MKVSVLASGSKGNSSYIETKETKIQNLEITKDIDLAVQGANDQLFQTRESAAAMDEISSQVIQIAKSLIFKGIAQFLIDF